MQITSAQNSKLKLVKRLRSKRGREAEARFVIDSQRDLRRALDCGYRVDFLLRCRELDELGDLGCEILEVSPQLLQKVSYRDNPDGMVAVLRSQLPKGRLWLEGAEIDSALLLVGLHVPGNIGALLRSADASGCDAALLVDCALDLYNPNIIRNSTGACFLDNIYQLNVGEALEYLGSAGLEIVAADVAGSSLYDESFAARTALVLGAEDRGLSGDWLANAHRRIRIPMAGRAADSLNVSVSGAILMFELQRQRHHNR
ncbi:MAG: RNA methyltransferase [Chloroflexi bacterium]|nr:RNA methyltransferase [Chloroflexota bacterium]MCY3581573.1 RNA methyltransferase [Chloroflexota bacterium]MCY3717679.1 RNA methyltransferase [Chloroflexota bacterium]MDE2649740.1 RNA methyltransferase [Chloroflexota bacterium]MXX83186.1 RNA methyltransferase [Chloroflexota bacterium]